MKMAGRSSPVRWALSHNPTRKDRPMSFTKAKENLERALAIAQQRDDKSLEEFLIEGLLEMNRAIRSDLTDIDNRIKALDHQVRRLS